MSREPYFETKLAEARSLLGDPYAALVSVKFRPTKSVESDSCAYAYPSDYRDLTCHLERFHQVSEGWISGGKARVFATADGFRFVTSEHETGPEIVVAIAAGAALGAVLVSLLREFVHIVQKNDHAKERYYQAGAISVERRDENGSSQVFVIPLPCADQELELRTEDFVLTVFGSNAGLGSRVKHTMKVGTAPEQIVILFMGANPSNVTQLALTREAQEIDNFLRSSELRDRFRVEQQWETQAQHVPGRIMRFKPTIVHFSGHGSRDGALVFQDQNGNAKPVEAGAISDIFRLLNDKVRCVILNACYSKTQAEAISEYVEVVIGMSSAIEDSGAIAFARAFYESLGYRKSVQTAFELAKAGISLSGLSGNFTPQLHARNDIDPSRLFLC